MFRKSAQKRSSITVLMAAMAVSAFCLGKLDGQELRRQGGKSSQRQEQAIQSQAAPQQAQPQVRQGQWTRQQGNAAAARTNPFKEMSPQDFEKLHRERAIPLRISGPFVHENLTLYFLHGPSVLFAGKIITLNEALTQKKVIVYETSQVNQLSIENTSATVTVFVQAGDIVKGGRQDRVIAFDFLVPPRSGKLPLDSFCVEAGRWTRRGNEEVSQFILNSSQAPTKDLKLAIRHRMGQGEVWENVAKAQTQIGMNVGKSVRSAQSATSLQLSLEDKELQKAATSYTSKLAGLPGMDKDIIGVVFAVNGAINSGEVYPSAELFRKVWPMLLESCVVEAIAELKKDKTFTQPTIEKVRQFLAEAEKGKAEVKEVSRNTRLIKQECKDSFLFESRDRTAKELVLRRSYLKK